MLHNVILYIYTFILYVYTHFMHNNWISPINLHMLQLQSQLYFCWKLVRKIGYNKTSKNLKPTQLIAEISIIPLIAAYCMKHSVCLWWWNKMLTQHCMKNEEAGYYLNASKDVDGGVVAAVYNHVSYHCNGYG